MIIQHLKNVKVSKILKLSVEDIRFPTSKDLTGSDAIHTDPDYSATYVTAYTDNENLKGFGIAFTIGKGNDIVAECIKHFFPIFENMQLDDLENNIGKLWFKCVDHSQLRWLGPEKGVVHMAVAAIFNCLWDLIAKKNKNQLLLFRKRGGNRTLSLAFLGGNYEEAYHDNQRRIGFWVRNKCKCSSQPDRRNSITQQRTRCVGDCIV